MTGDDLGTAFAQALGAKDFDRVKELLASDVDFRAMTPRRFWEAGDPDSVVSQVLEEWFEPSDDVKGLLEVETGDVGDRRRVRYRLRVDNSDGEQLVEQTAYYEVADGRISWMRIACVGYLPLERAA